MIRNLLIPVVLLCCFNFAVHPAFSQTGEDQGRLLERPLKAFDFSKGNYQLYIFRMEYPSDQSVKRIPMGYKNEPNILEQLSQQWELERIRVPSKQRNWDFQVDLMDGDQQIDRMRISINENILKTEQGTYKFNTQNLQHLLLFRKPFHVKREQAEDLFTAREKRKKGMSQEGCLWHSRHPWAEYEGIFTFSFRCRKDCFNDPEFNYTNYKTILDTLFKHKYPEAKYHLFGAGVSKVTLSPQIHTNTAFAQQLQNEEITMSWVPDPDSSQWKGSFWTIVKEDSSESIEERQSRVLQEIEEAHPEEIVKVEYDGHYTDQAFNYTVFKVTTSEALFTHYTLYPKGMRSWKPFDSFYLTSYWEGVAPEEDTGE